MKSPVKFGLIAGVLIIAFYLGLFYSENMFTRWGQFAWLISLGIMLPFLAMSMMAQRAEQGGFIGYKDALKAGLRTTIVTSLIFALFTYFFFHLAFADVYMKEVEKAIVPSKVDKKTALSMMRDAYLFTHPWAQATSILIRTVVAGAVLSFATSTFIVRKPNEE